jgi:ribonuclease BN (tRNA processing enzyme)
VVLTDVEHEGPEPDPGLAAFAAGAEFLLYDTMYTPAEYTRAVGWGHSTPEAGLDLQRAAGARHLIGIHHAPTHDDATLDRIDAGMRLASGGAARLARQGERLVIGAFDEAERADHRVTA